MKRLLLVTLLCSALVPALSAKAEECDECQRCCHGLSIVFKNGYFYPQDCVLRNIFNRCGNKGGYWPEGAIRYNFWKGLTAEISGSYFKHHGRATSCVIAGDTSIESPSLCYKTTVKMPTLGLGLKYFWNFCDMSDCCDWCSRWSLFVGAGMRVFFYREYDSALYTVDDVTTNAVRPCIKKNTVGGMVNGGIQCDLCHGFLLEFFVDYNFKKLKPCCNYSNNCCNSSNNCCNLDCCTTTTLEGTSCPSSYCKLDLGGAIVGLGIGYQF